MTSNAGCWTLRLAILAIVTSWLSSCATGVSEPHVVPVSLPVVEYTREFQAWAAGEIELLPEASAVLDMLKDYSVLREQLGGC